MWGKYRTKEPYWKFTNPVWISPPGTLRQPAPPSHPLRIKQPASGQAAPITSNHQFIRIEAVTNRLFQVTDFPASPDKTE